MRKPLYSYADLTDIAVNIFVRIEDGEEGIKYIESELIKMRDKYEEEIENAFEEGLITGREGR